MPDIMTQEDRNAAADILDEISSLTQDDGIGQVADLIRDGEYDEHDTVQRTARHRQAGVQQGLDMAAGRAFQLGDRVTKTKGSSWTGRIVGFYSTALTPEGYAIESETETGSVQIYPVGAIRKLGGGDA